VYPSGQWEGFWVQQELGRQAMTPFFLHFNGSEIEGSGKDIVGRFSFSGTVDEQTGNIVMVKQYIGRHRVIYRGQPDGEGSIQGTWQIGRFHTGPFLIRPLFQKPRSDAPIQDMS